MIDLTIKKDALERNLQNARENRIVIPTIAQMQQPETIPEKIRDRLKQVGLWDVDPLNLFRITWKNEAKAFGGGYQAVPNYVEFPPALTGVPCRIVAMAGKWFPTGCHKVGASFGCLAPAATRPSGPPPETTAGAGRSTPNSWARRAWPFSRRR